MSDLVSLDHSPDPSVFDIDTGYDTSSFDTPFSTVDGSGGIVDSFGTDAIPIDLDGDGNPEVVITHPGTSAEGLYFPHRALGLAHRRRLVRGQRRRPLPRLDPRHRHPRPVDRPRPR